MIHYFDIGLGITLVSVLGGFIFTVQFFYNYLKKRLSVLDSIADAFMGTRVIDTLDYAGDLLNAFDAVRGLAPRIFAKTRTDDVIAALIKQFDANVDKVKARKIRDDLLALDNPAMIAEKMTVGFDDDAIKAARNALGIFDGEP